MVGIIINNRGMDNNQSESMQNWKKQMILDPVLNSLLDNISSEEVLHEKILTLDQEHIMKIYIKLTSLKHSITKCIQKEVEVKYPLIEDTFFKAYQPNHPKPNQYPKHITSNLDTITKFVQGYANIQQSFIQYQNIHQLLYFSKALEKFHVFIKILKNLMKDSQTETNIKILESILNLPKISKILKDLTSLCLKHDFSGIEMYEKQKLFISKTKIFIYGIVEKQLTQLLTQIPKIIKEDNSENTLRADFEKNILNKFSLLSNLNKIKDFLTSFYKNILKDIGEIIKKGFQQVNSMQSDPLTLHLGFNKYFFQVVGVKILDASVILITFQQMLIKNNVNLLNTPNLFNKFWQKVIQFVSDIIKWNLEQESKQNAESMNNNKEVSLSQNLYTTYHTYVLTKQLNPASSAVIVKEASHLKSQPAENLILTLYLKHLSSIVWKYPIIYYHLTEVANSIHHLILKEIQYFDYQMILKKQLLLAGLLQIIQRYHQNLDFMFDFIKEQLTHIKIKIKIQSNVSNIQTNQDLFQEILFEEDRGNVNKFHFQTYNEVLKFLLCSVENQEIYTKIAKKNIIVLDEITQIMRIKFKAEGKDKNASKLKILQKVSRLFERNKCIVFSIDKEVQKDRSEEKEEEIIRIDGVENMVWLVKKYCSYEKEMLNHKRVE